MHCKLGLACDLLWLIECDTSDRVLIAFILTLLEPWNHHPVKNSDCPIEDEKPNAGKPKLPNRFPTSYVGEATLVPVSVELPNDYGIHEWSQVRLKEMLKLAMELWEIITHCYFKLNFSVFFYIMQENSETTRVEDNQGVQLSTPENLSLKYNPNVHSIIVKFHCLMFP